MHVYIYLENTHKAKHYSIVNTYSPYILRASEGEIEREEF